LIAGLNEAIYVEEGMVTFFANFAKALVGHTKSMDSEKKKDINGLLTILHRDSSKHKEMVENLIVEIERSPKDEF